MLAQHPDERFQKAGEIVTALAGATPVSGGHATAEYVLLARKKRSQRVAFIVVGGLVALSAATMIYRAVWGGAATPPNPIDPGMVVIPAGSYTIGTNAGADTRVKPAHQVRLAAFG